MARDRYYRTVGTLIIEPRCISQRNISATLPERYPPRISGDRTRKVISRGETRYGQEESDRVTYFRQPADNIRVIISLIIS